MYSKENLAFFNDILYEEDEPQHDNVDEPHL